MSEMRVSAVPGEELVAIGLGSCIGLVLVDRRGTVAGLAHIVLPYCAGASQPVGKYADLAVPELASRTLAAGAHRTHLQAVLIGGARMFALGGSLDIGARNREAVRAALRRERIVIAATDTGGVRGRTARVVVGAEVSAQQAGGKPITLLDLRLARAAPSPTFTSRLSGANA